MSSHTHPGQAANLTVVLRSALFALGLGVSVLVFGPLSLLTFPFRFPTRFRFIRRWTTFNLWWLAQSCGVRAEISGRENIPDSPCVVFCRHESAWETLALQLIFEPQVWVLKRELLWIPLFGWGLAMLRPIAIDRSAGRRAIAQVVAQGRERLEQGCWVIIFPEGTRVAPGARRRYLMGGAVLAEQTGHPVLPVAHNAGDFWPRRSFLKWPGTVRLVIGPVIQTRGKRAADINRQAEEWIQKTVAAIRCGPETPNIVASPSAEEAQSARQATRS